MRPICVSMAMSLDGYIAGPQGELDWIVSDPDIDFGALMGRFDTVLMGRKTYEVTRQHGRGAAMPGTTAYVISRTLGQEECPGVTVSDDLAGTVVALKAAEGKDVWLFGGGELFRRALDLGLIDAVEVAVVPVLLGGGLPFLPAPARRTRLRLASHRLYPKTGTVRLEYVPA